MPKQHSSERIGERPLPQTPFEMLKSLLQRRRFGRDVKVTEDHMLSVLLVRRARSTVFGENLFSDPAWDLLLELFAAKLGSRTITESDLATAINVPESTTRRWIAALAAEGLVETSAHPSRFDSRVVSMTCEAATKMQALADRWASAFTSIENVRERH